MRGYFDCWGGFVCVLFFNGGLFFCSSLRFNTHIHTHWTRHSTTKTTMANDRRRTMIDIFFFFFFFFLLLSGIAHTHKCKFISLLNINNTLSSLLNVRPLNSQLNSLLLLLLLWLLLLFLISTKWRMCCRHSIVNNEMHNS